jgi:hypothetical protein
MKRFVILTPMIMFVFSLFAKKVEIENAKTVAQNHMRNILRLLFILTAITVQGCKENENNLWVPCNTPPGPFKFEIVDKATGENLFTNGTYEPEQIEVINLNDDFIDENVINLIQINSIGWKTEKVNLLFKVANEDIFYLYVDAERIIEHGCSFTRYNEIKIENSEFEFDSSTGIYKILTELFKQSDYLRLNV